MVSSTKTIIQKFFRLSIANAVIMRVNMQELKKTKHYVNNEKLLEALIKYKEDCKIDPDTPIPDYIGECFLLIAEGFSHIHKYINYSFREEMVSDAVENCLRYFRNFDPEISKNPFAYFTQITYFAFLRRIEKEKKELYVKYKSVQNSGIFDEQHLLELGDGTTIQFEMYDNLSEFIENFETTKKKKKEVVNNKKGIEKFLE